MVRLVTWDDDRLKLEQIEPWAESDFFAQANYKLFTRNKLQRRILVYIHGYNTSFEDAAIRAAQIGFDLKVEGLTAFFSWPSGGGLDDYSGDEAAIGASEPLLENFLTRLVQDTGAEAVDVIAHSMGNRALLRVANSLESQGVTARFGQIILAAPDVDSRIFRNLADAYSRIADRTTLYVSDKDLALKGSKWKHSYARAGLYPPVTVIPAIDTIAVSDVDLTMLGHAYFANAEAVLYDIKTVLESDKSPDGRIRIRPRHTSAGASYWSIAP